MVSELRVTLATAEKRSYWDKWPQAHRHDWLGILHLDVQEMFLV